MLMRKKRGANFVNGVVGNAVPLAGKPSSSTSGRLMADGGCGGGVGGGE